MSKIQLKKIAHLLCSLLLGIFAFIISGILTSILAVCLSIPYGILYIIMAGCLSGLLLALFFQMRQNIGKMVLACIVAWLISYCVGYTFVDFLFQLFFTSFHILYEQGEFDAYILILMGVIFGAIFGAIVFGRKSALLFAIICGIISIPFGLLNIQFVDAWLKTFLIDFEQARIPLFLMFNLSFGISIGLGIGLYQMLTTSDNKGNIG